MNGKNLGNILIENYYQISMEQMIVNMKKEKIELLKLIDEKDKQNNDLNFEVNSLKDDLSILKFQLEKSQKLNLYLVEERNRIKNNNIELSTNIKDLKIVINNLYN
jgi:hypothetical protein